MAYYGNNGFPLQQFRESGQLFQGAEGMPQSIQRYVKEVRVALEAGGVSGYSGHSFRIGAVTKPAELAW